MPSCYVFALHVGYTTFVLVCLPKKNVFLLQLDSHILFLPQPVITIKQYYTSKSACCCSEYSSIKQEANIEMSVFTLYIKIMRKFICWSSFTNESLNQITWVNDPLTHSDKTLGMYQYLHLCTLPLFTYLFISCIWTKWVKLWCLWFSCKHLQNTHTLCTNKMCNNLHFLLNHM